jgi:hypothetical protein
VLEHDKRGREKWRLLRWRMSDHEAALWAAANSKTLQRAEGSQEERGPSPLMPSGGIMRSPGRE